MNRRLIHKIFVLVLTAAFGGGILYLGIPRAVGSLTMLEDDALTRRVEAGQRLTAEQIAALMASRRQAAEWLDSGRIRSELGLAHLLAAARTTPGTSGFDRLLDQSLAAIDDGLARAPADPAAWTRRAVVLLLRDGASEAVFEALKTSILTGPYDENLTYLRLRLCLGVWDWIPPEDRRLVVDQIRFALRHSPQRLTEAVASPAFRGIVRSALSTLPDDLAKFEYVLRRYDVRRDS